MQNEEIQTASALSKVDQKLKNSSNKILYKVRVFDKHDSKKIETYLSYKLDKNNNYIEFVGYISAFNIIQCYLENATSVDELTQVLAKNKEDVIETFLVKPWHQVVEIETVKAINKKQGE